MVADARIPAAGVLHPSRTDVARDAQTPNASSATLPQQSDPTAGMHFKRVTIKQLRSDPKTFAQQKVAVRGQIGEVSRTEHYFELLQGNDSLRVLLDSLPDSAQEKIYSAKPGSRVTASGEFSGYVLFAYRVELGK
ncbi:MAG: hypothetical protein LAO20_22655 [Acidobacteriia bacterium]|nr:hypothetical protein [Terriglobia bacterium]